MSKKKNQRSCLPELVSQVSIEQTILDDIAEKQARENSWRYQTGVKPFISSPKRRNNIKTPQVR